MGKCAHVWEQMPGIPEVTSPGTIVVDSLTMGLAHFFFNYVENIYKFFPWNNSEIL